MIALDTNVIVRALTRDDSVQFEMAAEVLRSGRTSVAKTVLLETEWVLRGAYGFDRPTINAGLRRFIGVETLEVEDRKQVVQALEWHAAGMDFADALHLASSSSTATFATFDEDLYKAATRLVSTPAVRLLAQK